MKQEIISISPTPTSSDVQELNKVSVLSDLVSSPTQPEVADQIPLDHNPAVIYLAGLKPTGRRSMQHHLNTISDLLLQSKRVEKKSPQYQTRYLLVKWHNLRYQHTSALRALLQEHYPAVATVNTALQALKGVLYQAWQLGLMTTEEHGRAANLKAVKGSKLLRGRQLHSKELTALVDVCTKDPSPAGARDAAMLALLYGAGLRRSEVIKLRIEDYDPESGSIRVLGAKGNKDRLGYLGSQQEVSAWLALLDTLGELEDRARPLFVSINKAGKLGKTALSDQSVRKILNKRSTEAGVASFSPHDLRRTFISDLLDAGADIATVQKMAGHADVSTTTRYDRRGEESKQKAARLLRLKHTEPRNSINEE